MYQLTAPMSHVSACFNHMTGLTKDCTSFSTVFFACFGFSSCFIDTDPFDALNMFNVEFWDRRWRKCGTGTRACARLRGG